MSDLGNLMSNPDLADDASRALIQSLKVRIAELEDQIEQKFKELDKKYNDLFSDNQHLRQDYASLQDDYNEQQQIAADIRSEATNLLEEIKALSKKNEELKDQNDIQMETIRRLRDEIAGLQKSQQPRQNGYGNGSGQQDAQSRGAPDADAPPPSYSGQMRKNVNIDYEQDDIIDAGIIGMQFVESYRSAVADLIRASRSETPTSVLVAMKGIVIACRSITEDSEAYENNPDCGLDDYERSELIDVKNKLSMSLTNQMGIAKELATNFSSGTVSSLEAATADLSATIVELLHIYQRHTGLSNPIERPPAQSNPAQPTAGDAQGENYGIEELKVFLERQTDLIVQAIQSLLLAMRQSSSFGQDFIDTVGTITRIVDNLVRVSRVTLGKPQAAAFRDSSEPILQELSVANVRLNELGEAMVASPQSKTLKQKIASSSYDIAKFVKELISLIE
nr:component of the polarisome [Polyrhizophydium stewartii]